MWQQLNSIRKTANSSNHRNQLLLVFKIFASIHKWKRQHCHSKLNTRSYLVHTYQQKKTIKATNTLGRVLRNPTVFKICIETNNLTDQSKILRRISKGISHMRYDMSCRIRRMYVVRKKTHFSSHSVLSLSYVFPIRIIISF